MSFPSTALLSRILPLVRRAHGGIPAILKLNSVANSVSYNLTRNIQVRQFSFTCQKSSRIFEGICRLYLPELSGAAHFSRRVILSQRTLTTSSCLGTKGIHENPRNEKIRSKKIVLIDEDGTKLATVSIKDALQTAKDKQLELVEIQKQIGTRAAVCKMFSRKAIYEAQKKHKHSDHGMKVKELTITGRIAPQDLQWKIKKIHDFLSHGNGVKLSITRKPYHKITDEDKLDIVRKVVEGIKDVGELEEQPKHIGAMMLRCKFKPVKPKEGV